MKQKIISFTATVLLLLCTLSVPACATPQGGLSVSKTELKRGDTVTVTLTVPGVAEPIHNINIKIFFSSSAFTLTSFNAPEISGASKTLTTPNEIIGDGMIGANYISQNDASDVSIASGLTLSAVFTVKNDAPDGSYDFIVGRDFSVETCDTTVLSVTDLSPWNLLVNVSVPTYTVTVYKSATDPEALFGYSLSDGEYVERPGEPGEDNMIFGGWFTERACIHLYKFPTPIHENLDLFGCWISDTIFTEPYKAESLVIMKRILLETVEFDDPSADVNGDGQINILDLIHLENMIAAG